MHTFDPKTAVYTPQEVTKYGLEMIRRMEASKSRGAFLPIEEIGEYFAPVLPGQICAVIAQTSNYKSGFCHFWQRALANQLTVQNRLDEAIIHVSVEEGIEEQSFLYLARESGEEAGRLARGHVKDWKSLNIAAAKISGIPIYRLGDSLARADDMPELYLSNIAKGIRSLVDGEITGDPIKPAAIFFDYLQAFPFDPEVKAMQAKEMQRRLQVREDIYRMRMAAAAFNCPVIIAVQAKQHLSGAPSDKWQQPGIYDGEESSAIAQRADRVITLWMPKTTSPVNTVLEHGSLTMMVQEYALMVKVAKQRGGLPAGKTFPCRIEFANNEIELDRSLWQ